MTFFKLPKFKNLCSSKSESKPSTTTQPESTKEMAGELILITGTSGHVGFRVLAEALQAGYRARAVVRKAEQVTKIKATKSIAPYADKVEFVVVPDLSVDGAFDAHTSGVSYIIHVAAQQFTSVDVPIDVAEFAKSNVKFTQNILEAAAKAPSVKRVLITSSVTTLFTGEGLQGDSDLVLSWKSEVAKDLVSPHPEKAVGPIAYVISKVLSAKLVEKFVEERKPHFTVASILLGTTIGRFELASESKELVSGSNIVPLPLALSPIAQSLRPDFYPPPPSLLSPAPLRPCRARCTLTLAPPPGAAHSDRIVRGLRHMVDDLEEVFRP
ncbi:hypothetical protein NLJ89_g7557 [Agrocybe chaxingu]|uniref:NAD-dependent epimerase/dehydratase domain-containing protein n=1 Tax=Agrocybe chaxingu TaxID=84603 RepID=A0A9W8JWE5_9AGAR|nr:hypothetical protein NLJ89_g7557 [Agrocybe chaxingu]